MDRFSIPNIDVDTGGSELLAETFGPNGTRMIPTITDVVRPRAGTGVSLIAHENKCRRRAIAAAAASLACAATLLAIYVM
jgi:hypothetical protein